MKENSTRKDNINAGLKILDDFANLYGNTVEMTESDYKKIQFAINHILSDYKRVLKENKELNKSKITLERVNNIQEKTRRIVEKNYISKNKIKRILEETEVTDFNSLVETFLKIKKLLESE